MLQAMRTGAKSVIVKFILFGFLMMAMLGLVFMDVQGVFRGGVVRANVAEIGGQGLSSMEFDQIVRRSLNRLGISTGEALKQGLIYQILNQEIQGRLLNLAAHDSGLVVGNKAAAAQVKNLLSPLTAHGMTEKQALQQFLVQENLSEGQFTRMMKEQIAAETLQRAVLAGSYAPEQLVKDFYRFQNEKRVAKLVKVTVGDIDPVPDPTPEQLQEFYNAIGEFYRVPEYRDLSLVVLKSEAVIEAGDISEDQVKEEYESRRAEFEIPEERTIAQAILPNKEMALLVHEAAQNSKNLKAAVREVTGDTDAYLEPDDYISTGLPEELADVAFKVDKGTVSAPVESSLGWHVLFVKDIKPAKVQPFEEVKEGLRSELMRDAALNMLFETANEFEDRLAGGATLQEAAQEMGFPLIDTVPLSSEALDQKGQKTDLLFPAFDDVIKAAFALPVGETSQAIESPDGEYVFVTVNDIIPSAPKPLEEVKDEVTQRWREREQALAMQTLATKLVEQMRAGKKTFQDVATELGNTIHVTPELSRSTRPEDMKDLPGGLVSMVFTLENVGDILNYADSGQQVIARLSEIRPADPSAEDADLDTLAAVLQRSVREDLAEQFRNGLIREFGVDVNEKTLTLMYGGEDGGV